MATKPVYESEPIGNLTLAANSTLSFGTNAAIVGPAGSPVAYVLGGAGILTSVQTAAANATDSQAAGTPITGTSVAVTAAGASYSVTLPVSVPGMQIDVLNVSSQTIHVYPNAGGTTTETINALSANAEYAMTTAKSTTFVCVVAGQWWTNPRVAS